MGTINKFVLKFIQTNAAVHPCEASVCNSCLKGKSPSILTAVQLVPLVR